MASIAAIAPNLAFQIREARILVAECWMAVPRYCGSYAVSDQGRVMSFISRRAGKNPLPILSAAVSKRNKYPHVLLYKPDKSRKSLRVAELVARAFLGMKPKNREINHKDGIKGNSCLDNLEYVTRSENGLHAFRIGIQKPSGVAKIGESNPNARFTEDKIREIRTRYADGGISHAKLAKQHGCPPAHITRIIQRRAWRHVN